MYCGLSYWPSPFMEPALVIAGMTEVDNKDDGSNQNCKNSQCEWCCMY